MERMLYVTSKALEGKPRLIGVLSENDGRYKFEYKLGGKLQEWFLLIDEFPDVNKVYEGAEVEQFIFRTIPREDNFYIKEFMESYNLARYDVWDMLKAFGPNNVSKQDAFLYEELPEGVILYEQLETV